MLGRVYTVFEFCQITTMNAAWWLTCFLIPTFASAIAEIRQTNFVAVSSPKDVIFTENVLFDFQDASLVLCACLCQRTERCVYITSHATTDMPGRCRGHSAVMTSNSPQVTSLGSHAYTSEEAVCSQTSTSLDKIVWRNSDSGRFRVVSAGEAGVWGIGENNTVWLRTGNDSTDCGEKSPSVASWTQVVGKEIVQLSVGLNSVWGLEASGQVNARTRVTRSLPQGNPWVTFNGRLTQVSVSPNDHVWGVNSNQLVYRWVGASSTSPLETPWEAVDGYLVQISVGMSGVWGINANSKVFYRQGTHSDIDTNGTAWVQVDGLLKYVSSEDGFLVGVTPNNEVVVRMGVSAATPTGTCWKKVAGEMSVVEFSGTSFWGVNSPGLAYCAKYNPN